MPILRLRNSTDVRLLAAEFSRVPHTRAIVSEAARLASMEHRSQTTDEFNRIIRVVTRRLVAIHSSQRLSSTSALAVGRDWLRRSQTLEALHLDFLAGTEGAVSSLVSELRNAALLTALRDHSNYLLAHHCSTAHERHLVAKAWLRHKKVATKQPWELTRFPEHLLRTWSANLV